MKNTGDDRMRSSLFCCALQWVGLLTMTLAGCVSDQPQVFPPAPREIQQLKSDIQFLADPQQEGRGIGTAGQARAGEMLVKRLRSLGLQAALPDRSFRQPFTTPATRPATTQPIAMFNVIAQRTGKIADEFIIVGAHYDHLGYGGKGSVVPWSHAIHPGADDNASGTAAVLALARRIADGPQPRRTIVFVLFAGEERGLLGSAWFVRHPPMPLSKLVAMLNFDMVGRLKDDRVYIGGERTAEPFPKLVHAANRPVGLELKVFAPGGGGPSDHRAFSERHIPVLFFFTGLHAAYHTPQDTADAVNYDGLEQIVSLAANCVNQLAQISFPTYRDADDDQPSILTPVAKRKQARLGVEIEPTGRDGAIVGSVGDHSPAERAGIKVGDAIVAVDRSPIHNFQDFQLSMSSAMPGDEVRVTIRRKGKMLRVTATLAEQKD